MKKIVKIVFTLIALFSLTLVFTANVKAVSMTDEQMVQADLSLVTVPDRAIISFPVAIQSPYGNIFEWSSDNEEVLEFMDGWFVVKRPLDQDVRVTVTVKVSRPEESGFNGTRHFEVLVPKGVTNAPVYSITYENVTAEQAADLKSEYKLGEASFQLEEISVPEEEAQFLGWYADEELTQPVTSVKVGTQGNLTFYAKWEKPATYIVIHYTTSVDGSGEVILDEETFDSFVGRTVHAESKSFGQGYSYDPDGSVLQGVVREDDSLELRVYYIRNTFQVILYTEGGSFTEEDIEAYSIYTGTHEGQEIYYLLVPYEYVFQSSESLPQPVKEGYEFVGWNGEFPYTIIENDSFRASWTPVLVDYTIEYYLENLDGEFELHETVTDQEYTDTQLNITNAKAFTGFTYVPGHENEQNNLVIAGDGSTVFKFYYTRNSHTITYNLNGGSWGLPTVVTYKYGEQVEVPTETPVKEGNTFVGWSQEHPATMPDYDLELSALWSEIPIYNVTFDTQGGTPVSPLQVMEGYTATKPENDPTKVGYIFRGWYTQAEGGEVFNFATPINESVTIYAQWDSALVNYTVKHFVENILDDEYTLHQSFDKQALTASTVTELALELDGFTAQVASIQEEVLADGSLVIEFYYTRNVYTITVVTNDPAQADITITKKYQAEVSAPELSRNGYTFGGWSVSFPETMPLGGLEVEVTWVAIQYTINYVIANPYGLVFVNNNPATYTIEDLVELVGLVVDEDVVFIGWFVDEDMTTSITEIVKGSTGEVTVYGLIRYTDEKSLDLDLQWLDELYEDFLTQETLVVKGLYGSTIRWQSLTTAYSVSASGVVTITATDVEQQVTLYAMVENGDYVDYLVFTFVIPADDGIDALTVEEFLELADGEIATVQGYIYKYNDGAYLVSENGVAVLVFKYFDVNHGDYVVITGEKDFYNHTPQFARDSITDCEVISSGNELPLTVIPMTIEEIVTSEFPGANLFGKYLEVIGTVFVDPTDSRYYVLKDENGKSLSLYQSNTTVLASLLGEKVKINVFFYGNGNASGTGVWRVVFTGYEGEYSIVEKTPEEKIAEAIEEVNIPTQVTGDIVLPTSGLHGVTITWTTSNPAIDPETGVVIRPEAGQPDLTVTLTATFSLDGVEVQVEYTVTVKAEQETGGEIFADDLFISEYIEGSSNNKAIEIYNGTGNDVELSNYQIRVYANGATSPTNTITLSGTLKNGEVYVICHSSSNAQIKALADQQSGSLSHNGDDAIALVKNGVIIDVVGTIGSTTKFGENVTLIRKPEFTGNVNYDPNEWTRITIVDDISDLGKHTFAPGN